MENFMWKKDSSKIFHSQIFFQLKWIILLAKFLKIKYLKLNSLMRLMIYIYIIDSYFPRNVNFKCTTAARRRSFNSFRLFSIFFISSLYLLLSLSKFSCTKKHHVYNLCNIIRHISVINMYCWTFLRKLFFLLFPTNCTCCS